MTFREWVVKYCSERGMFDNQAQAVLERVMADEASMTGRWNDTIAGYPSVLLTVLAMTVNQAAVAYIEENCPNAWFKAVFEGNA